MPLDLLRAPAAPKHRPRADDAVAASAATVARTRVVHVITRLLLGGAEENTIATCLHQADHGQEVVVVHGLGADPSWEQRFGERVTFVPLPAMVHPVRPLADFRAMVALARMLRRIDADVVHTHGSKAGIVGRLAAAAAGVPLIVHTIHIAPFLAVGRARRLFYVTAERFCARISHLLIAVSRGMQQAYLDADIGGTLPLPVVHSGMPLEGFVDALPPSDWRSRIGGWDGPGRPRFVLKLASFEERKRQHALIEALAPGLRRRPDTCLLLAGQGPDVARCRATVAALGLAAQIRFLGHDPRPWELVALADLCVHAAEREGLPRSAIQAIAGGTPLVVADLPGIDELVEDGVNGIVTDPHDLSDLADRLFGLLDHPGELSRLSDGARATDVSSWRQELMGERVERAYRTALAGREARPRAIRRIEFFGLPGAGKTTIANELERLLRGERGSVATSRDRLGDEQAFAGRTARRLALVTRALLTEGVSLARGIASFGALDGSLRDRAKTRWNLLCVLALNLTRGSKELLLADQGLAQAVWSARVQHGAAATAAGLFSRSLAGTGETLFVHFTTPRDVARERLGRREKQSSRFQEEGRIEDEGLWHRASAAIERFSAELAGELGERGLSGRLLRLDAGQGISPRAQANLIYEQWRSLEAQPSSA